MVHYLLIRLVEEGGSLAVVMAAQARARTWSPVTVSCSSRAAVSWARASRWLVSRSRARVSALVSRAATSWSTSHWVCSE